MTRFGVGNFRQTYEGAVHTRNTYKNVALSIRTIRGSCPRPGADTRLGTKNLCEGDTLQLQIVAQSSVSEAQSKLHAGVVQLRCMLVSSPGRGVTGGSCCSHPRQSTHLSPIYQQLVLGPTPWQRLGNTFPEHLSSIPMTDLIPAQVSTF